MNSTGSCPISYAKSFSLQPSLEGPFLLLRPLQQDDFEALYEAAADPLTWAQHPSPLRYQRAVFEEWFKSAIESKGSLAVIDRNVGKIIGTSRYYELNEQQREVSIGFTFLARAYWGGITNRELKWLMLSHAFRWGETVWFHVAPQNIRSQKAVEKIGARFSHRGVKHLTGGPQEYVFFRMAASDLELLAPAG